MAFNRSLLKTSEETFDYICTPCAEDNLIKEALKYCVECQQYCCKDCLTSHRRISSLKGHTFLDNSSVKTQGQPRSLPSIPTKQCSKHLGMIMYMYCENHDVVCCYVCAAEDHKLCKDMMSVSDNINRLYNKTHTSKVISELSDILDDMNKWQADTDTILQQLQNSKVAAIKTISDCRVEIEKFLKKLEQESIKEIENEYKKLESQILEERKIYEDSIDDLKTLQQLIKQASGNIAQLFVCTKLAENKCTTLGDDEMKRERFKYAEVKFVPSILLKSSIKKMKHLGEAISSSRKTNRILYKASKICDMNVRLKEDASQYKCWIPGSCIINDSVIFTDYENNKLKRFDILSLSLIDYCDVPVHPYGVCRVGDKQVAVACRCGVVQFVSIDDKLSLSHSINVNHWCYGIAHSKDKLYITDGNMSLRMYDMSGKLLKTVSRDQRGQPIFEHSNHITFNDTNGILFVCDYNKRLVCFNAQCDHIEALTDRNIRPTGVCIDDYDNVIVADRRSQIIQCRRYEKKRGIIVNKTRGSPCSVCIHHGLKTMIVGLDESNTVEVYKLF